MAMLVLIADCERQARGWTFDIISLLALCWPMIRGASPAENVVTGLGYSDLCKAEGIVTMTLCIRSGSRFYPWGERVF